MTRNEHAMHVQIGRYVAAHGRFESNRTNVLDLDSGERHAYLSRTFTCACGGKMLDGDPYVRNEHGDFAHEACAHLLEGAVS